MNATDEEQDEGVGSEPEFGASLHLATGAEDVEIHSRMHDVDPSGRCGVQVDELRGLLAGVGDETRGLVDDLLLADLAHRGLWAIAGRELAILDLGHGVHGVDQRYIPALGGEPAHLP